MKFVTITTALILSLMACQSGTAQKESKSGNSGNNQQATTATAEASATETITSEKKQTMKTIHLTEAEFLVKVANYKENPSEWKYLGDKPCLIDFYADWCAPCKMLAPILEELAAEYEGKIHIYKIDTEKELALSSAFGIRSIPTLLFVPQAETPQIAQGALPKQELKRIINEVLLGKEAAQ